MLLSYSFPVLLKHKITVLTAMRMTIWTKNNFRLIILLTLIWCTQVFVNGEKFAQRIFSQTGHYKSGQTLLLSTSCGGTWRICCTQKSQRPITANRGIHWLHTGKQQGNKFSFETCRIAHTVQWRLFWTAISVT